MYLSCGRAPWLPRRIAGRDLFWWLDKSGFLDATVESLPDPSARLLANILASGARGGHDLHLRTLHDLGVVLLGHLAGIEGRRCRFEPDLLASVAWGDERLVQLGEHLATSAMKSGIPKPEIPPPEPPDWEPPVTLDLSGFAAVIFAGGFRPDYGSWVRVPGAFDELGFPVHEDGASIAVPGLYFVGVHVLRKRKSSLFIGVGEDASVVADRVAADGSARRR